MRELCRKKRGENNTLTFTQIGGSFSPFFFRTTTYSLTGGENVAQCTYCFYDIEKEMDQKPRIVGETVGGGLDDDAVGFCGREIGAATRRESTRSTFRQ